MTHPPARAERLMHHVLPLAVLVVGLGLVAWSVLAPPPVQPRRVPDMDQRPPPSAGVGVDLRGSFTAGSGKPAPAGEDWPAFRGPDGDNVSREGIALATDWGAAGPRKRWSIACGFGYAAPAVAGGRVFLADYDVERQQDALRCLSLADGAEIWRRAYPMVCKFNHGMSRTVPAVADGTVVSIGPRCHVLACDAASGDFRWGIDLVRTYGSKEPPWYAGQCPLIDRGRVILAPAGGEVLLMAVDLASGTPAWTTPNPRKLAMSHSSVLCATIDGQRQYIYPAMTGIVAVAAEDGRLLWEYSGWKVTIAWVPTPVQAGPDLVLFAGGYNAGALMLKVAHSDGVWRAEPAWTLPAREFGSDQQTPIVHQGAIFGVIPDGQMVCLGLDGKRRWASGRADRFGIGPYVIADGKLLIVNDTGLFTVAEASTTAWKRLAQAQVLDGHDSWGPIAVAGGAVLVRDLDTLTCLDLGKP